MPDSVKPCRPADLGRFEIHRRTGSARIGRLHTHHGILETPALLPVVNPNIGTVPPREMWDGFGIRGLITNSYVIWKHDELRESARRDGVHSLLDFPGVVVTDSGTFQSYVYGDVEVGVEEIVQFQRDLGVDIGTMLDVFGRPDMTREELEVAVEETADRAQPSLDTAGSDLLLNGPIQGGTHCDLRSRSARLMGGATARESAGGRGFAVHPIGGIVPIMEQHRYRELVDIVLATRKTDPIERPIHLFGCGHPMLFALAASIGVDLFDSAAYVLFARDCRLLSVEGTIRIDDLVEWPITSSALVGTTPAEVREMNENDRTALLARHNLEVSVTEIRACREAIRDGTIHRLAERRSHASPRLREAYLHLSRRLQTAALLPDPEGASSHLMEMVRSTAPIHAGPVAVDGAEGMQPRNIHLRMLLETRWSPQRTEVGSPPPSILFHGAPPPWRHSIGQLVHELLSAKPDAIPMVWTPIGAIPYSLEDVAPWCHLDGPDGIWMFDGDAMEIQASLGLTDRSIEVIDASGFESDSEWRPDPEMLESLERTSIIDKASLFLCLPAEEARNLTDGMTVRRSRTGRIKNVLLADGRHIISPRLKDGGLSMTLDGARIMHSIRTAPIPNRHSAAPPFITEESSGTTQRSQDLLLGTPMVVIEEGAVPFVGVGRNVIHGFIIASDPHIAPGLPCLVMDEAGRLVAHGVATSTAREMSRFRKGIAVKVRDGALRAEDVRSGD